MLPEHTISQIDSTSGIPLLVAILRALNMQCRAQVMNLTSMKLTE